MQVEEKLKQQQMPAEKQDDFRINCFHERRETCLKGTIISVFVTRYEENKNDIPFFESLIQNKILSQDEIKKQLKEQQPIGTRVPLAYLLVVSAFAKKMVSDEATMEIGVSYIREFYPNIKKKARRFVENKLDFKEAEKILSKGSREMCFMLEVLLMCNDYSLHFILDSYWDANETRIFLPLSVYEKNSREILSKIIGYDFEEKPKILNRYIIYRKYELLEHLCADSVCSADDLINANCEDSAICAAAIGAAKSMSARNLPKELIKTGFAQMQAEKDNHVQIDMTFPKNRIMVSPYSDVLSKLVPELFSGIYSLEYYELRLLHDSANWCKRIVDGCIVSRLTDMVSDSFFDEHKQLIVKEEIVRNYSYIEHPEEIEVVLEKIRGVYTLFISTLLIKERFEKLMENVDFEHLSYFISPPGSTVKQKDTDKVCYDAIMKKYHETQKKLSNVEYMNEILKSQNDTLMEENVKLTNQLNKENRTGEVIDELKQQVKELTGKLERCQAKLKEKEEVPDTEASDKPDIQPFSSELPGEDEINQLLSSTRFLIVGGRWEVTRALCDLSPRSKRILKVGDNNQDVQQFDAVVFFTEYVNHGSYNNYVEQCRRSGAKQIYLTGSNMYQIKVKLYAALTGGETTNRDGNANNVAS